MLADPAVERFRVVDCRQCGGLLKPDVVFFGENVPRPRVDDCYALVERAGRWSCWVLADGDVGLPVRSAGGEAPDPVVIINQGRTRGDPQAMATIDAPLGPALTALVQRLGGTERRGASSTIRTTSSRPDRLAQASLHRDQASDAGAGGWDRRSPPSSVTLDLGLASSTRRRLPGRHSELLVGRGVAGRARSCAGWPRSTASTGPWATATRVLGERPTSSTPCDALL